MTLKLSNNTLTRYVTRQGYAAAENVPLVGDLTAVAEGLLAWLSAQLASGETLADLVIEPAGKVATAYEVTQDEEGQRGADACGVSQRLERGGERQCGARFADLCAVE